MKGLIASFPWMRQKMDENGHDRSTIISRDWRPTMETNEVFDCPEKVKFLQPMVIGSKDPSLLCEMTDKC